jgi:hypothetical protein
VFLNSPHRETPKNVIKRNREKIGFCNVFELPSLRNTRKRDAKEIEEKLTSKFCRFVWEKFLTWTSCKNILVVFLNSPSREAPKTALRKSQEKQKQDGGRVTRVGLGFSTCTVGSVTFFWRPLAPRTTAVAALRVCIFLC